MTQSKEDFNDCTRYIYTKRDLRKIRISVRKTIKMLGFDVQARHISIAQTRDSTLLSLNIVTKYSNKEFLYEYPFEKRKYHSDPFVLRANTIDRILSSLHTQRWISLREETLRNEMALICKDNRKERANTQDKHFNSTKLSAWARKYAENNKTIKFSTTYHDSVYGYGKIEVSIKCEINVNIGKIVVEEDSITLPIKIPETMCEVAKMKFLRDFVELPSCGDPEFDSVIGKLFISSVKNRENQNGSSAKIEVITTKSYPFIENESKWRKLKDFKPFLHRKPPEFNKVDMEVSVPEYHRKCDEILGVKTELPLNLKNGI